MAEESSKHARPAGRRGVSGLGRCQSTREYICPTPQIEKWRPPTDPAKWETTTSTATARQGRGPSPLWDRSTENLHLDPRFNDPVRLCHNSGASLPVRQKVSPRVDNWVESGGRKPRDSPPSRRHSRLLVWVGLRSRHPHLCREGKERLGNPAEGSPLPSGTGRGTPTLPEKRPPDTPYPEDSRRAGPPTPNGRRALTVLGT